MEYDWSGEYFATVIPIHEIEQAPEFEDKEAELAYLVQKRDEWKDWARAELGDWMDEYKTQLRNSSNEYGG